MLWTEYYEDAQGELKARMMWWRPETEQEWEDANRFYEATQWRSYSSFAELRARPRQPGPFVVRCGLGGVFIYLHTAGEDYLRLAEQRRLEPVEGLWTHDPREAVALSHDHAIRLTIRLQSILGEPKPEQLFYLEPVPLAEAVETHRRFARSSH